MRTWLAVAALVAAGHWTYASAAPVVVVLDSPQVAVFDEFVALLRVQVRGTAGVQVEPPPATLTVGERVAEAAQRMAQHEAMLAVWVEPAGERAYVVYAVASQDDRALVEIVRVPATDTADVARVMAIKVSNVVDLVMRSRGGGEAPDVGAAFAPPPHPDVVSPARSVEWAAELSGALALPAGTVDSQAGLGVAVGPELRLGRLVLGAFAGGRWVSGLATETERGRVNVSELDAGVGVRVGVAWGRIVAAGEVEAAARFLDADGVAMDGREESESTVVPVVRSSLGLEVRLTEAIAVRASAGLETALVRQRFLLLREPMADLGRFRPIAALTVGWRLR